jgi:lipoic acid synthetase
MRTDGDFSAVHDLVGDLSLHTVCQSARCPNIHECWGQGTATLMLLGDICTRDCAFCTIKAGRPVELDSEEPSRVAEAAAKMNLSHVVLTSVARDDLADGGSSIFAATIRAIRETLPEATLEVLTPDFGGDEGAIQGVLEAGPDVYNHNLETVRRLQSVIRPQASYGRSLGVLRAASKWNPAPAVKSGIMLGLGESEEELIAAMSDLLDVGCELLTLGQYLQPTRNHAEVQRFASPEEFDRLRQVALEMGFAGVASGPMVRSSYKAEELLDQAMQRRGTRNSRIA